MKDFFKAGTGFSMARLCAFIIVLSVAIAIDWLAFVCHVFNGSEALAVGSITTMCGAVWFRSKYVHQTQKDSQ
jgi:hypothetical protein